MEIAQTCAPFAVALLVFCLTFFIIDMFAKTICPAPWKIRYVRSAVFVGLLGSFVLMGATLVVSAQKASAALRPHIPDNLSALSSEMLMIDLLKIQFLWGTSWFLENFPLYVVLPTAIVLLGGYASERSKQVTPLANSDEALLKLNEEQFDNPPDFSDITVC